MFSSIIGQDYDMLQLICPAATEMSRLVGNTVLAYPNTTEVARTVRSSEGSESTKSLQCHLWKRRDLLAWRRRCKGKKDDVRQQNEAVERHWQLQIEKATYEAEQAATQHHRTGESTGQHKSSNASGMSASMPWTLCALRRRPRRRAIARSPWRSSASAARQ